MNETWRSASGREREPESGGDAAVPSDGAEADIATSNGADATADDCTDLSIQRFTFPAPTCPKPREERVKPGALGRRRSPAQQRGASSGRGLSLVPR